jgi:hypothetical protein
LPSATGGVVESKVVIVLMVLRLMTFSDNIKAISMKIYLLSNKETPFNNRGNKKGDCL